MEVIFFLFLICFIAVIIVNLLFPQHWFIKLISPFICPNAIYFQNTNQPLIALTIDDSPDADTTQEILAILAQYQVTATFFPIANQIATNQTVMAAIIEGGHEIGNHLTEDEPSIKLKDNFATDLNKAHQVLSKFATKNKTIKWLRPCCGWCNQAMIETAAKHNYQVVLGSVWSYDTHIPSSSFASWFILANTKPGSIIVLHDVAQRGKRTIATLKKVLPELQKKGYRFVTLSELFANNF